MIIGRAATNRSSSALQLWRWISVSSGTEAELNGKRFAALWGNGDYGRLGHGSLESRWTPNALLSSAFDNQSLCEIACGGAHTLFLTGWSNGGKTELFGPWSWSHMVFLSRSWNFLVVHGGDGGFKVVDGWKEAAHMMEKIAVLLRSSDLDSLVMKLNKSSYRSAVIPWKSEAIIPQHRNHGFYSK
ncbi:hypothetical protein HAX54_030770 [Datura stramonium]|uniref:Uncharacterized protein n=1 Tax=Datura stramonium TaxID=4076 RepID=A0ABS8SBA7_DATST|nr:hypothetical protein [Datura stramonium]